MLGYLLARRNVPVMVLEKHADFFRDFRGDTVHPSTLELLHELGLLDEFLKLPHQEIKAVSAGFGDFTFQVADFTHVPARSKFVALMPQWDFLNFLSRHAQKYPAFDLRLQHEAIEMTRDGDRITGVLARGPGKENVHVRAHLVVGADGRHSITRESGQMDLLEFGVPVDVLWFRISRRPDDPKAVLGSVNFGKALILVDRSDYFQAGLIIPKGSFEEIKRRGLESFRKDILQIARYFGDRVNEVRDWDQVKILTVQINRLERWYRDGLLCIGDAAHAMSPAGGVGINLAIQDAVATANLLARPLQERRVTEADLAAVQRRREFPAQITQAVQVKLHTALAGVFESPGPVRAPWQLKIAVRIPGLQRALGYAVGMGARPEHIESGARPEKRPSWKPMLAGVGIGLAIASVVLWGSRRRYA
jgi:2-polyprenyl-6-methoxyphenol hydroxylase-like FAD-dependent oxidoreductase